MRTLPSRGVAASLLGVASVAALTVLAARYGHATGTGKPHWDWGIGSAVATAGGTTLLAIGTFMLAYGTRRPKLSLEAGEAFRTHSHVESDVRPYLRLLVRNQRGRRSAAGTRVLVEGYRRHDDRAMRTLGSPSLGWPSAPEATDASVVIFGGSGRPIGLGDMWRLKTTADGSLETVQVIGGDQMLVFPHHQPDDPTARWYLKLSLSHGLLIGDFREFLPPGHWTIRVVLGADEADGRAYEIDIQWDGEAKDAYAALDSVIIDVKPA